MLYENSALRVQEIHRGELWLVHAEAKRGKTKRLCEFAAACMTANYNVLFVTMECTQAVMRSRIWQISRAGRDDSLRVLSPKLGEMTPRNLDQALDDLHISHGFIPDVVCLDDMHLANTVPSVPFDGAVLGTTLQGYQRVASDRAVWLILSLQAARPVVKRPPGVKAKVSDPA